MERVGCIESVRKGKDQEVEKEERGLEGIRVLWDRETEHIDCIVKKKRERECG